MPIVTFVPDENGEQAMGGKLNNEFMTVFFAKRRNPLNLIHGGGHRIDDAPEYAETEMKVFPEYKKVNGRNVVEESVSAPDFIKAVTVTMGLPSRNISVTDALYAQQSKGVQFDMVIAPKNCDDGCDRVFFVGREATLMTSRFTNGLVGYDENGAPITLTRQIRNKGNLLKYSGLVPSTLSREEDVDITVFTVIEDLCDAGDCPDAYMVRGGLINDTLDASFVEYSTDGGLNWTAFVVPTSDLIPSDIIYFNGRLLVVLTDDPTGAAVTTSAIWISNGLGEDFVAVTGLTLEDYLTIQSLGTTLYAFGTGVARSVDGGYNWEELYDIDTDVVTVSTRVQNTIFVGGTNGFIATFTGGSLIDVDVDVPTTLAENVTALSPLVNGVQIGTATGRLLENFDVFRAGSQWYETQFGSGSDAITGIASDPYGYRTVVGFDDQVMLRDVNTEQEWELALTLSTGAAVTGVWLGQILDGEGANAFYVTGSFLGEFVAYTACGRCI